MKKIYIIPKIKLANTELGLMILNNVSYIYNNNEEHTYMPKDVGDGNGLEVGTKDRGFYQGYDNWE